MSSILGIKQGRERIENIRKRRMEEVNPQGDENFGQFQGNIVNFL